MFTLLYVKVYFFECRKYQKIKTTKKNANKRKKCKQLPTFNIMLQSVYAQQNRKG